MLVFDVHRCRGRSDEYASSLTPTGIPKLHDFRDRLADVLAGIILPACGNG
jgi:hypothetical protein